MRIRGGSEYSLGETCALSSRKVSLTKRSGSTLHLESEPYFSSIESIASLCESRCDVDERPGEPLLGGMDKVLIAEHISFYTPQYTLAWLRLPDSGSRCRRLPRHDGMYGKKERKEPQGMKQGQFSPSGPSRSGAVSSRRHTPAPISPSFPSYTINFIRESIDEVSWTSDATTVRPSRPLNDVC